MKRVFQLFTVVLIFISFNAVGQISQLKKFDYNLLKNKVLYIQKFSENDESIKKYFKKKGAAKKASLQANIEMYNKLWTDAMAKSSYDATPYEIRDFDSQKLFKEKNKEAIILTYSVDKFGNEFADLFITGPKKVHIANTLINGLNLFDVNDLSLMMNMLNYTLNELAEIDATTKDKSRSGLWGKAKENMVQFYSNISQQTFYVVKEDGLDDMDKLIEKYEKDPELKNDPEIKKLISKNKKSPSEKKKALEKANEANKDIEEALKENWTLCKYEMISEEDFIKKKEEGVANGFYWKSFRYYTNNILLTYKFRYLLTMDRDEVVFFYYSLGNASFKSATVKDLQNKIIQKSEKYKKQLDKE
jgi:hypothetical protein